jgi:hypothetical protein
VNEEPSNLLHPLVHRFSVYDEDKREVEVSIFAGLATSAKDEGKQEPEDVTEAERAAGWYVFGNERLLLGPDKSPITGWIGRGYLPVYHNQFSRFRGYVYMSAKDPIALPWNTTKTGVETADPVWVAVRGEMVRAGRQVIDLLNQLKNERKVVETLERPLTKALASARATTVATVERNTTADSDAVAPSPNPAIAAAKGKRISYSVEEDEFDRVSNAIGEQTASGLGRATFDYYLETVVEVD